MTIKTNILSINAHRHMSGNALAMRNSASRLSSGFRINSAADDAAGLSISEKMRAQIRGLDRAAMNSQDGISLIQTAEGALASVNEMLIRIRELIVQAANDINTLTDREKIQDEINQIISEIDSISQRTEFNTKILLSGDFARTAVRTTAILTGGPGGAGGTGGPGTVVTLYGARASGVSMQNNAALRAVAPGVTFGNGSLYNISMQINTEVNVLLDIGFGVMQYDSTFADFIRNDLFEPDGRITQDNMQRFVSTLQEGIRMELREWEATGSDLGSDYLIVDFDHAGRIFVGFSNNAYQIHSIAVAIGTYDPNDFVHAFFYSLLGGVGSSTHTFSREPATQVGGGGGIERIVTTHTSNGLWLQMGANSSQGMNVFIEAVDSETLGLRLGRSILIDVVQNEGKSISFLLDKMDSALKYVTRIRSELGAVQNRLEYSIKNLDISSENLRSSESRIRDADMAREMMHLTKANILQQASTTILATANQNPQAVLQLL